MTSPRHLPPSYRPPQSDDDSSRSGERRSVRPGPDSDRLALLRQIDSMRKPGLAKALPTAKQLRKRAEEEAAALFDAACKAADVPLRELARGCAVHHSSIDDARRGRRNPSLWMLRRLPREAQIQFVRDFVLGIPAVDPEFTPDADADDDEEPGLRRVG